MYRVVLHRRAVKSFQKLPTDEQTRIRKALDQLRADPRETPGIRPMLGPWKGYWRLRVGGLRVIFWPEDDEKVLYVDHIGPRGDIYKA